MSIENALYKFITIMYMNSTTVESERYCKYFNPASVDCDNFNPMGDKKQ